MERYISYVTHCPNRQAGHLEIAQNGGGLPRPSEYMVMVTTFALCRTGAKAVTLRYTTINGGLVHVIGLMSRRERWKGRRSFRIRAPLYQIIANDVGTISGRTG